MADIQTELDKIAVASFGRDVRGSIGDALKKMNSEIDVTPHAIATFTDFATAATGISIDNASVAYTVSGRRTAVVKIGAFTSDSHAKTHIVTIDADHIPLINTGVTGYVDTGVGTYQPITGDIDASDGKLYIYTPGIDTAYDSATVYLDYYCGL